jgi:hypothetical protein
MARVWDASHIWLAFSASLRLAAVFSKAKKVRAAWGRPPARVPVGGRGGWGRDRPRGS